MVELEDPERYPVSVNALAFLLDHWLEDRFCGGFT